MLRIGLTGGIGTGKSTASKILSDLGAYIFDADKEHRAVIQTDTEARMVINFNYELN